MTVNWILILVGFCAGLFSATVGFGGGMILLPVITSIYGIELAIPISTIAQMLSNLSKVGIGFKEVKWKHVGFFLLTAAPLTALGALGFGIANKVIMTRILCIVLIIFAILKITGKLSLPKTQNTMLIGGGLTGFINGMMGISGPLSSAVFLTLELAPVAYIASEAAAATAMHVIKIFVYNKLALVNLNIFLNGLYIGIAMIAGNFIAMNLIGKIKNKVYQKIVATAMIGLSIWLFFSV